MRSLAAVAVLLALSATASAERPRLVTVPLKIDPSVGPNRAAVVNSKIIFLNRCKGGCKVISGFTDSRIDKSDIGAGTLSAFGSGDTTWNSVVACVKQTFAPFNVTVTDVDPGTEDHFEVMIAGTPGQLGLPSYVGGIAEYGCTAPGQCTKYQANALVFDFAGVWGNNVNDLCSTAAQEIAHTWSLDHVTDASDPMTYNPYTGMRKFKDGVKCGSDCQNGTSPFGLTCNTAGEHTCMSTGVATQDDIKILTALFGPAGAKDPTLKLVNPTNNSAQVPGFQIDVDCQSTDGIQEVDLSIDGVPKASLSAAPFTFTAPTNLTEGPHTVEVLCATKLQAITKAKATVLVGQPCVDGQCSQTGYICFSGACIGGPDAPGGLGATCAGNTDCIAGLCANDGTTSACTIPCDLTAKNCPDGFGCLDAGNMMGVCWAGYDDGGGCCDTSGSNGAGSMLLALGIAATFVTRKRRR